MKYNYEVYVLEGHDINGNEVWTRVYPLSFSMEMNLYWANEPKVSFDFDNRKNLMHPEILCAREICDIAKQIMVLRNPPVPDSPLDPANAASQVYRGIINAPKSSIDSSSLKLSIDTRDYYRDLLINKQTGDSIYWSFTNADPRDLIKATIGEAFVYNEVFKSDENIDPNTTENIDAQNGVMQLILAGDKYTHSGHATSMQLKNSDWDTMGTIKDVGFVITGDSVQPTLSNDTYGPGKTYDNMPWYMNFEGDITGWTFSNKSKITIDVSNSGRKSLMIDAPTGVQTCTGPTIKVEAGCWYQAGALIRNNLNNQNITLSVNEYSDVDATTLVSSSQYSTVFEPNEAEKKEKFEEDYFTFQTSSSTMSIRLTLNIGEACSGSCYIDDLFVTRCGVPNVSELTLEVSRDDGIKFYHVPVGYNGANWKGKLLSFEDNLIKAYANADPEFETLTGWTVVSGSVGQSIDSHCIQLSSDGVTPAVLRCYIPKLPRDTELKFTVKARYAGTTGSPDYLHVDLNAGSLYDSDDQEMKVLGSVNQTTVFTEFSKTFDSGRPPGAVYARIFTYSTRPIEVDSIKLEYMEKYTSRFRYRMTLVAQKFDAAYKTLATLPDPSKILNPKKGNMYLVGTPTYEHYGDPATVDNPFWKQDGKIATYGDNQTWTFSDRIISDGASPVINGIFIVCSTESDTGITSEKIEIPNNPSLVTGVVTIDLGRISRFDALSNVIKITGQEAWISGNGKLNVVNTRGSKVQKIFSVGTDIVTLSRDLDRADMCNALTLIGNGETKSGMGLEHIVNVEDPESIAKYGRIEKTMKESNIDDMGVLAARSWVILQATKEPSESIEADVIDSSRKWSWGMGDTVTLVDKSNSIFNVNTRKAEKFPVTVKRESPSLGMTTCRSDTTDTTWEDPFMYNRTTYAPFDKTYNSMRWTFIQGVLSANGMFITGNTYSEGYLLAPAFDLYDSRVIINTEKAYLGGILSRFVDYYDFYLIKFSDGSGALNSSGLGTIQICKSNQGSYVIKKDPPTSPVEGDKYLVDIGATGDWKTKSGFLAEWKDNGASADPRFSWTYTDPESVSDIFTKLAETNITWVSGTPMQIEVVTYGGLGDYKYMVIDKGRNTPPSTDLYVNDAYLVGPAPTGAWAGRHDQIAVCSQVTPSITWSFPYVVTDMDKHTAYVQSEKNVYEFTLSSFSWSAKPTAALIEVWVNNVCALTAVDGNNPPTHGWAGLWAYSDKKVSGTTIPSNVNIMPLVPSPLPDSGSKIIIDNHVPPTGDYAYHSDQIATLNAYQYTALSKSLNSPPTAVRVKDVYIVGTSGSGAWLNHSNQIATCTQVSPSVVWSFATATNGQAAYVSGENKMYSFNGSTWSPLASLWASFEDVPDKARYEVPYSSVGSWNGHDYQIAIMDKSGCTTPTVTVSGDSKGQTNGWKLTGTNGTNTRNYRLYWKLTNNGDATTGTRNLAIYKDTQMTLQVAAGSRAGDGAMTISAVSSSGITGSVNIKYIEAATDSTHYVDVSKPTWNFTTTVDENATNFRDLTIYNMRNAPRYASAPAVLKNAPVLVRDSPAYKFDGSSVAAGIPRYESINLLTALQSSIETDNINEVGYAATSTGGTTIETTTGVAKYGTRSLKVTTTGSDWDNYVNLGSGDSGDIRIPVVPNQTYTLSAYVYVPAGTDITPSALSENGRDWRINVWSAPNQYNKSYSNPVTAVGQWQRLTVSFTTPTNMTECFARLYLTTRTEAGTRMYIDGVQLEQGGVATTWVIGGSNNAMIIEEGTTNLAANMTITANGSGGVFTSTNGTGQWTGWTRVNITETNDSGGMQLRLPWVSIPADATYTWAVDLIVDSGGYTITPRLDGQWGINDCTRIPGTNRWKCTWTNNRGTAVLDGIYFSTNAPANTLVNIVFYIRCYQVESKAYPTSFTGYGVEREDECLYVSSNGIMTGNAGTAEMIATFPLNGRWMTDTVYPTLLWAGAASQGINANQIYMDIVAPNGNLRIVIYDANGNYKVIQTNAPVTAGNHYLAYTWDTTGPRAIYIDGQPMLSETIGTGTGSCAQTAKVCIGYNGYDGKRQINSLLSQIRISNKVKAAADISNTWAGMESLGVETCTTYLLKLNGTLIPLSHTPYTNGNGILIEESTTNLFTYGVSTVADTSYFGTNAPLIARNTTDLINNNETSRQTNERVLNGTASLSVRVSSTNNNDSYVYTGAVMLKPSTNYAWSAWVYAPSTTYLNLSGIYLAEWQGTWRGIATAKMDNDQTGFVSLTKGWHYLYGTGTTPSDWNPNTRLILRPSRTSANDAFDSSVTIYYECLQLEEDKTHPTSWVPGGMTRLGEKIVLPGFNILSMDDGGVEFLVSMVDLPNDGSVLFEWGGGEDIDDIDDTYKYDNINIAYHLLSDAIGQYDAIEITLHKKDVAVGSEIKFSVPVPGRKFLKTGLYYIAAGWVTNQTDANLNQLKLVVYDYETCSYMEEVLTPFASSNEPALTTYKEAFLGGNGTMNSRLVVSQFRSSCKHRDTRGTSDAFLKVDSNTSSSTYGSVIPTYQSSSGPYDLYTTYYAPLTGKDAYIVDNQLRVTKASIKIDTDGESISLEFANRNTALDTKVDNLVSNINEYMGSEQATMLPQPVSYTENIDTEHPAETMIWIDDSREVLDIVFSASSAPFRSTSRSNKGESEHTHGISHNHNTPDHSHTSGNHQHTFDIPSHQHIVYQTNASGYYVTVDDTYYGLQYPGSGPQHQIVFDVGADLLYSASTTNPSSGSTNFGGGGSTTVAQSATDSANGSKHQHDIEYGIFEYNMQYKDDGTVSGNPTLAPCRMYVNQLPTTKPFIESYLDDRNHEAVRVTTSVITGGGYAFNKFGVQGNINTPFRVVGMSLKELYSADGSRPLKPGANYLYIVPIPDKTPTGYFTSVPENSGWTLTHTVSSEATGNQTVYTGTKVTFDQYGEQIGNSVPNVPIPTGLTNPKGLLRVYVDVRVIYRS